MAGCARLDDGVVVGHIRSGDGLQKGPRALMVHHMLHRPQHEAAQAAAGSLVQLRVQQ